MYVLSPWPWPRAFLSLTLRGSLLRRASLDLGLEFFVFVALASSVVPSTPHLIKIKNDVTGFTKVKSITINQKQSSVEVIFG